MVHRVLRHPAAPDPEVPWRGALHRLAAAGVAITLCVAVLAPVWVFARFDLSVGTSFLLLLAIYSTVLVGSTGRTVGHSLLRLQVVRSNGNQVSYWRAFVRWIGYLLCTATIFIGFAIAIWDKDRQGLHDKLADTVVIGNRASLPAKVLASVLLLAMLGLGISLLAWLF